jgi:SAM-dependent methyltransferase
MKVLDDDVVFHPMSEAPHPHRTAFAAVPRRQGKRMDMRSLHRTIEWRREMGRRHEESARRLKPAVIVARCPACDATKHSVFVVIFGFAYHECGSCGHLFLQNPPSAEAIATLYQGETVQAAVYVGDELFRRRVDQISRPKAEFCREYVEPGEIWFDVGCGTGELLSAARELGFSPRGCEADPAHVRFARGQQLDVIEGYVDRLPSDVAGGVRVLSLLNLLEHIPEPRVWLERMTAPLRVGAHVLVEVPRHPSLSSLSNLLYPALASRHIYPPDHMHIFTERSLEHVLGVCGLEARALWVFGQDFQELMYSSAASAGLAESAFFHQLLDATNSIQRAIDDENLCDVLLVLAQKR